MRPPVQNDDKLGDILDMHIVATDQNELPCDINVLTADRLPVVVDRAAATAALQGKVLPHFRGLLEAVRDFACGLMMVFHRREPFAPPADEPWMVLIGDDTYFALGPDGFDRLSLEEIVRRSAHVVIVASGPEPLPYNIAATCAAMHRKNAVVIETRPKQKDAWLTFVKDTNPEAGLTICMPFPEGMR